MLITILAHIIVFLGTAALAALIVKLVIMTFQKFLSIIKKKLASKYGGTVAVMSIKKVADEAIAEAKRTGNVKNLAQLQEMADQEGIAIAVQDSDGNINANDIEIFQAESIEQQVYSQMDEDGILIIGD